MVTIVPISNDKDEGKSGKCHLRLDGGGDGAAGPVRTPGVKFDNGCDSDPKARDVGQCQEFTVPENAKSKPVKNPDVATGSAPPGWLPSLGTASTNENPTASTSTSNDYKDRKRITGLTRQITTNSANLQSQYPHYLGELPHGSTQDLEDSQETHIEWFSQKPRWFFYFHPDSPVRLAWSGVVVLLLLYTGTIMPYRLCFVDFRIGGSGAKEPFWVYWDIGVDCLFWGDLILQFVFAYYNTRGVLVCHPKAIAMSYLRGWFLPDLLACLPPEALGWTGANKALRFHRLGKLARIGRLLRVARLFKVAAMSRNYMIKKIEGWIQRWIGNTRLIKLVKFIVRLLFILHLLACAWYLAAALEVEEEMENTWVYRREIQDDPHERQWLTGMYFILTVITTVGFGDIGPMTNTEIVFVLFLMVIGAVVNSIVLSEIITIFQSVDGVSIALSQKQRCVNKFYKMSHLSEELRVKLHKHITYGIKTGKDANSLLGMSNKDSQCLETVFSDAPYEIQRKVAYEAFEGQLHRNAFFMSDSDDKAACLDYRFIAATSVYLTPIHFKPQQYVYSYGEQCSGVYMISKGTIAFLAEATAKGGVIHAPGKSGQHLNNMTPFQLISSGGYFGEGECVSLSSPVRKNTLRAESDCEILFLPRRAFYSLMRSAPHKHEEFRHMANIRKHHTKMRLIRHTFGHADHRVLAVKIMLANVRQRLANKKRGMGSSGATPQASLKKSKTVIQRTETSDAQATPSSSSLASTLKPQASGEDDKSPAPGSPKQTEEAEIIDVSDSPVSSPAFQKNEESAEIQAIRQDVGDLLREQSKILAKLEEQDESQGSDVAKIQEDVKDLKREQGKILTMLQHLYISSQAGPAPGESGSEKKK